MQQVAEQSPLWSWVRRLSLVLWLLLVIVGAGFAFIEPAPGQVESTKYLWFALVLVILAVINFSLTLLRISVWKVPAVIYHITTGLCLVFTFLTIRIDMLALPVLNSLGSPIAQTNLFRIIGVFWGTLSFLVGMALALFDGSIVFIRDADLEDILGGDSCMSCGISITGSICHFCDKSQAVRFYLHPLVPLNTSSIPLEFEFGSNRRYVGRAAYREGFIDVNEDPILQGVSRYHALLTYNFSEQTLSLQRTTSSSVIRVNYHDAEELDQPVRVGDILQFGEATFLLALPYAEITLAFWQSVNSSNEGSYWISFVQGEAESKTVGHNADCDIQINSKYAASEHLSISYIFEQKRFRVGNLSRRENSVRLGKFELAPMEFDYIDASQTTKVQIMGLDYLFIPVAVDNRVT